MKYYISILLLSISGLTFSQVKLEGYVKDSIGNPLELANVIAINKATSALDSETEISVMKAIQNLRNKQ